MRKQISLALTLRLVTTEIVDATLRMDLSARVPLQNRRKLVNMQQGLVNVHYNDLKHAKAVLKDIQEQHLMHQVKLLDYYQIPHEGLCREKAISASGLKRIRSVFWDQCTKPFPIKPIAYWFSIWIPIFRWVH